MKRTLHIKGFGREKNLPYKSQEIHVNIFRKHSKLDGKLNFPQVVIPR